MRCSPVGSTRRAEANNVRLNTTEPQTHEMSKIVMQQEQHPSCLAFLSSFIGVETSRCVRIGHHSPQTETLLQSLSCRKESAPPPAHGHSCPQRAPKGDALRPVLRPFCLSNGAAVRNVRAPTWWQSRDTFGDGCGEIPLASLLAAVKVRPAYSPPQGGFFILAERIQAL